MRMQRRFVIAIVAALAVAAAWLLRGEEPFALARPAAPPGPQQVDAPAVGRAVPAERPVVRDELPPAAAPRAAELQRDAFEALQRTLGGGELEAIVVLGTQPLAGARVRVWVRGDGRLGASDRGAALHEQRTDAEGRAQFRGLAAGTYVVRADHGGRWAEAEGLVFAGTDALSAARTVVLPFGTAGIAGTVCDDNGAPRAGVPVYLVRVQKQCAVAAVTDASGAFELGGLYGGRWHVMLDQAPEQWSSANARMLTLQIGERARMDFGGLQPAGSWDGRIVDAEGGAVPGERELRVRHASHNDERRVRADANGEFAIALPPGRWEMLTGDWFATAVLAAADVDRREVRTDVVWPGIRLVAVANVPAQVDAARLKECLTLKPYDARWLQPDAAFVADDQSIVQWLGVPEGSYLLQIGNGLYFTDAPNTGIRVHVSSARVQRVIVNVQRKT